jgi:hypothetical protein
MKNIDLDILTDLLVLNTSQYERFFFLILSICTYACVYVRLANGWTVGRILFIFDILKCIHHTFVIGDYQRSIFKNRGPS